MSNLRENQYISVMFVIGASHNKGRQVNTNATKSKYLIGLYTPLDTFSASGIIEKRVAY